MPHCTDQSRSLNRNTPHRVDPGAVPQLLLLRAQSRHTRLILTSLLISSSSSILISGYTACALEPWRHAARYTPAPSHL
eukprot:1011739-Prorocentrum_minimum.AAC.1